MIKTIILLWTWDILEASQVRLDCVKHAPEKAVQACTLMEACWYH